MTDITGKILTVLLLISIGFVASCNNNSREIAAPSETFQVSLVDLDIHRVSNDETVAVDLIGITSEVMTLD